MDIPAPAPKHLGALALLAVSLALTACSGSGSPAVTPPVPRGNLFLNPGLEDGSAPWFSLDETSGFARTEEQAHGGLASALLQMRDPPQAEGAKVYYLVQEIASAEFPEVVKGFYRVENWQKGTAKQYIQFAVIVFNPKNFPTSSPNWQIRYPLAGIDSPPFPIGNAQFRFLGTEEPAQGQWVPFQANIKDDFERLWGRVPEDFEKIRVLFEVRWDDKEAGTVAAADVYYDDLYIGTASAD